METVSLAVYLAGLSETRKLNKRNGATRGDRTRDLLITNQPLCQLS